MQPKREMIERQTLQSVENKQSSLIRKLKAKKIPGKFLDALNLAGQIRVGDWDEIRNQVSRGVEHRDIETARVKLAEVAYFEHLITIFKNLTTKFISLFS